MVTQKQSLATDLFSVCPPEGHVLGCAFTSDPHKVAPGRWWCKVLTPESKLYTEPRGVKANTYLCVSAFKTERRTKDNFVAQLAVMVDDVGGTIPIEKMPGDFPPTWTIETSEGNFQFWYVLQDPIVDRLRAEALVAALQARGLSKADGGDTGFSGVTRLGRANGGLNTKGGRSWKVNGQRTGPLVTQAELMEAFGIDEEELTKKRGRKKADGRGPTGDLELQQALEEDPMIEFLEEQGLIKQIRDDGWLDISCPWLDEHTGGIDDGTAYRIARFSGSGQGGFRCHHGHCHERNLGDLMEWAEAQGWEGVPQAADEFAVLEGDKSLRERLAERYTWVAERSAFLDLVTGGFVSSESLEGHVSSMEGISVKRGKNNSIMFGFSEMVGDKPAFYRIGSWLRHWAERSVDTVTWQPGEGRIFEREGTRYANLWIDPPRYPPATARPWLDHVARLYPDAADDIVRWLSFVVQHPGIKINHALVLGGPQGCGKNAVLAPLERIPGFTSSTLLGDVMSGFGDWSYGRKLVIINESRRTQKFSAEDVHNLLKVFIAAPPFTLRVNGKYKPQIEVPNVLSCVITSNYSDSLHLDKGDRRYRVCWTDVLPDEQYFIRLWGWFERGDPIATRHRLRLFKWALTAFFLVLGVATLLAYIKIGIEHAPNYGQHYVPAALAGVAP